MASKDQHESVRDDNDSTTGETDVRNEPGTQATPDDDTLDRKWTQGHMMHRLSATRTQQDALEVRVSRLERRDGNSQQPTLQTTRLSEHGHTQTINAADDVRIEIWPDGLRTIHIIAPSGRAISTPNEVPRTLAGQAARDLPEHHETRHQRPRSGSDIHGRQPIKRTNQQSHQVQEGMTQDEEATAPSPVLHGEALGNLAHTQAMSKSIGTSLAQENTGVPDQTHEPPTPIPGPASGHQIVQPKSADDERARATGAGEHDGVAEHSGSLSDPDPDPNVEAARTKSVSMARKQKQKPKQTPRADRIDPPVSPHSSDSRPPADNKNWTWEERPLPSKNDKKGGESNFIGESMQLLHAAGDNGRLLRGSVASASGVGAASQPQTRNGPGDKARSQSLQLPDQDVDTANTAKPAVKAKGKGRLKPTVKAPPLPSLATTGDPTATSRPFPNLPTPSQQEARPDSSLQLANTSGFRKKHNLDMFGYPRRPASPSSHDDSGMESDARTKKRAGDEEEAQAKRKKTKGEPGFNTGGAVIADVEDGETAVGVKRKVVSFELEGGGGARGRTGGGEGSVFGLKSKAARDEDVDEDEDEGVAIESGGSGAGVKRKRKVAGDEDEEEYVDGEDNDEGGKEEGDDEEWEDDEDDGDGSPRRGSPPKKARTSRKG
ncbi:hypothetical protein LTR86_005187 [Recurvomyces mirabilis]|nr:hypothetical protein LTR86_005187 [Recurvomyces mirabilis]